MNAIKSLCVLGFFSLVLVSHVEAQPKNNQPAPKSAAELFEEASNLFKIKEYEKALSIFKQIYLDTSEPALLFNIGQCQKNLGQFEDALKSFQTFIRDAPQNPLRANAEARIAELQEEIRKAAALGAVDLSTKQDPAAVFLDGESKGNSPLKLEQITPGQHLVRVEKAGFLVTELTINVIADQTVTLEVPMAPIPPKVTEDKPFFAKLPPKLIPKLTIASIGAGTMGLALGGVALFSAQSANKLQNKCADPDLPCTEEEGLANADKVPGLQLRAVISGAASDALFVVAALSAGTVFMYKKQTKKAEVALSLGTNNASLSVRY